MALEQTTLARIKLIAKDDLNIQALNENDPEVIMLLEDVELFITLDLFGSQVEIARRYFGAHVLSLAAQPTGGRGPLSSESIGGISTSFTLPYLNRRDILGSTQFGMEFIRIRDMVIPAFYVGIPPGSTNV